MLYSLSGWKCSDEQCNVIDGNIFGFYVYIFNDCLIAMSLHMNNSSYGYSDIYKGNGLYETSFK